MRQSPVIGQGPIALRDPSPGGVQGVFIARPKHGPRGTYKLSMGKDSFNN